MTLPRLIPTLLAVALTGSVIRAETTFRLSTRNEPIPENGVVTHTVLKTDSHEFSFFPPPQWKQEVDSKAGALSWTSPDFRSMIRMQLAAGTSNAVLKLRSDELRQALLARHKQVTILEEFPCYTSGLSGIAFDWERPGEGGFVIRSRSAFIPIAGCAAELTLTTPRDQFDKRHMDLMRLLNSFRVSASQPQLSERTLQP